MLLSCTGRPIRERPTVIKELNQDSEMPITVFITAWNMLEEWMKNPVSLPITPME